MIHLVAIAFDAIHISLLLAMQNTSIEIMLVCSRTAILYAVQFSHLRHTLYNEAISQYLNWSHVLLVMMIGALTISQLGATIGVQAFFVFVDLTLLSIHAIMLCLDF